MQKLLIFPVAIAEAIIKYYGECSDKEQILLLYLKEGGEGIYVNHIVFPPIGEYRLSSRNKASLKPTYLLERIVDAINEDAAGIMLMHNHTNFIPLFSSSDRQANKMFFRFFQQNNIDIIAGSAVYAKNRVSYVTNSDLLRNCYCVRLHNERG